MRSGDDGGDLIRWAAPQAVGLLVGAGVALYSGLDVAVRVLISGIVATVALLAAIALRQRPRLRMLDDYVAAHPDLERAACEGCGSKHLLYPEPGRVYCLACKRDVVTDPDADAAAERSAEIHGMTPAERVASAVDDLQRAAEWLQLVSAKSAELPGFLTIDFLASFDRERSDWEDRDRFEQLSALVELATLLQEELRMAHQKIDGVDAADLPPTYVGDQWRLLEVVREYTREKLETKMVSHLPPVFESLRESIESHLALLGAASTPSSTESS